MKNFLISLTKVKFVRDIATMQVGQVVTTGAGFLSSILFARFLGLGGYGTYAIVLAFTGLLGFITNFGQQATALTFFSKAYGEKDSTRIKEILHYYFVVSVCSALFLLALMYFLPAITERMYDSAEIGKLARIIFASSIIDPLFVFGSIILQSVREIRKLTILENSRIVIQLGLSILFLINGMGVKGVLLGSLFGTAIMSLVSILTYNKIRPTYNLPSFSEILCVKSYKHVWRLVVDGIWITIDKNTKNLYPNIFVAILGMYAQESVVGLFRLAFKLGNLPTSFVLTNIGKLATSVIPTLIGKGVAIRSSLLRLTVYSCSIHIGATIGALLIVPPLIPIVYGGAFDVAIYPLIIIAVLHTSNVIHALITPILRMYSRMHYAIGFNVIATISSLGLFYILMGRIRITFALYIALSVFHVISILVVIPALSLIKNKIPQQ